MHFKIGNRRLGDDSPTYIIAEMSANHGGSLETAIEIVRAANRAGADAVKLQTYRADTITLDSNKEDFKLPKESPWRDSKNLYALYDEAHTPWEWHHELFKEAKKLGIDIFSAPFDTTAVDFLEEIDCPVYKIASPEINDIPLIKKCAQTKKPVILSTGLASILDIERAIKTLEENGCSSYAFLKCTTAYPAPLEEANLGAIQIIKDKYSCLAGISDHTTGTLVPALSIAMGANIIEKHFTLNNGKETVDSFFSLNEDEFTEMVTQVRNAEKALGTRIEMSQTSSKNLRGRRSLYVSKDIKKGEILSHNNIKSVRPSFGLPPRYLDKILNKESSVDLEKGQRLDFSHIGLNSKPEIKIFCDGNNNIGTGHVKRSVSLANFLNTNYMPTKVYPLSEEARELIPASLLTENLNTELAIIDTPLDFSDLSQSLLKNQTKILGLDLKKDYGQNNTISVFEHSPLEFKNKLTGFEYIIIREDIRETPKASSPTTTENVLVILGGGDLKGESSKVAQILVNQGYKVNLVLGPLAKTPDNLPNGITLYSNPENLPELMKECDWAISNGGGCLFELLYLNKPVHVLPQTQAEENIANHFLSIEAILGVGLNNLKNYNLPQLKKVYSKSLYVVDGHGTGRIQMVLEDIYNE